MIAMSILELIDLAHSETGRDRSQFIDLLRGVIAAVGIADASQTDAEIICRLINRAPGYRFPESTENR